MQIVTRIKLQYKVTKSLKETMLSHDRNHNRKYIATLCNRNNKGEHYNIM